MQRRNIFLIVIIAILIVALGIIGYLFYQTSNNNNYNLNNTFSKDNISFNYPSNFNETHLNFTVSPGSSVKTLVSLRGPNNETTITVQEVSLKDVPSMTIKELEDLSKTNIKANSDTQYLSDIKLNLTGIPEAYESIYSMTDPKTNKFKKGFDLFIGKQGQTAYAISVYGLNGDFNNTKSLYDKLLPTIKMN